MKKIILILEALLMTAFVMAEENRSVKLNSGYDMPVLGLGTWTLTGETCENAVYAALKSGYRLIDTAKYYGNEREVGNAIRRAIKDGKIRSIGISNFYTGKTVSHFINDFEIPPAVIQNENHLKYQNNSLREWAAKKGIYIESYYPFGGRGHTKEHLQHETVLEIARAHGKSAAQIIVRWHLQSGYITIPGSSNPAHIAENFDVWDFELTENEMKKLNALNTGRRYENW